ncbi:hypothetical protein SPHV1_960005 [Novosphingobium sp. KN65.2]|nr:hypothetical protein SPHV1_960005 [Novosphingobium sp. KN65.2]
MLTFVFLARLVEIGVHEFSGDIDHPANGAADRCTIDVDVEHAHENGNARNRLRIHRPGAAAVLHGQFTRRRDLLDQRDKAIGRRNDRALVLRRHANRIAEEGQYAQGEHSKRPTDPRAQQQPACNRDHPGDAAELATFGMDGGPAPRSFAATLVIENISGHGSLLEVLVGYRNAKEYRSFPGGVSPMSVMGKLVVDRAGFEPTYACAGRFTVCCL